MLSHGRWWNVSYLLFHLSTSSFTGQVRGTPRKIIYIKIMLKIDLKLILWILALLVYCLHKWAILVFEFSFFYRSLCPHVCTHACLTSAVFKMATNTTDWKCLLWKLFLNLESEKTLLEIFQCCDTPSSTCVMEFCMRTLSNVICVR